MVVMQFHNQYLVIDCVKFGQEDAIDSMRLAGGGQIQQPLIELRQLIHGIIADQSFSNKEHQLWVVSADQITERSHERLVVLHAACTQSIRTDC